MRKGLRREITRNLAELIAAQEPGWILADRCVARRVGPWVQVIGVDDSRWSDDFVPRSGLTYLRSWDEVPRVEALLLSRRLKTERHRVDDWITERRFRSDPAAVIDQIRAQVLPRVDMPLGPEVAERLVREDVADWHTHHALCFIAAERLDRQEAERHLVGLERATADRMVDDWIESARRVVEMIDRPEELRRHLDAIEEAKLASIKGRPLG